MEPYDEGDKGCVVMCIFPQLVRIVKGDHGVQKFTVVKARAVLQSSFNFGVDGF